MHVVMALGYALAYSLVQAVSARQGSFILPLRVACLLLIPRRYWAAMVLGELGPMIYLNLQCVQDFGPTWVVLNSIPGLVFAIPPVVWFLRGGGLFPSNRWVNMQRLWCCLAAASLIWTLRSYGILLAVRLPTGPYVIPSGMALMFFANAYLGLFIWVPWVVMVRLRGRMDTWRVPSWRTWLSRPWARDAAIATLATLVLMGMQHQLDGQGKFIMVMALFLAPIWLTVRHGWRAAVFGCTLVWMAAYSLWTWRVGETDVQELRWLVIVLTTCLYVFGVRISEQSQRNQQLMLTTQARQRVAKDALLRGENRLAQASMALESVVGMLQIDYDHVLDHFVPAEQRERQRKLARHLRTQVMRLAESISPSAWRDRGVVAALNETVGGVLYEAGITYGCDASKRSLETLSQVLQAAIYRITGEAMAVLSESYECARIDLTVRTLWRQRRRWVVLRIDSTEDQAHIARALEHAQERHRVGMKLGASMHDVNEVRQFVRVFDGTLRMRRMGDGMRMSVLLREGPQRGECERKAPIRWRVR
ncbi:MAG TPA: hypothetical protein VME63_16650 [Dyella sp.]|uniref:hypothetical protein n=1 Tax=Dyella sp. TaxID=1869338 RepID=UPI002BD4A698|nr:hypothetical protein [Dyella sp.]HTV87032.1 hypothetical protein [Dyella sp.]